MKRKLVFYFLPLAIIYFLLVLAFPMDAATIARRNLTEGQARTIATIVALVIMSVWLMALYGAQKLSTYSKRIRNQPDGPAFSQLALGINLIAWYIPIRAISKAGLNYIASINPSLQNPVNDIVTYINMLVPLIAFVIISQAARSFDNLAKIHNSTKALYTLSLAFIVLGVSYCYVSFTVQDIISPTNWLVTTMSSMPLFLRISTIVIPYLFTWCIGLIAAYELYLYQKQIKGVFYRKLLRQLSFGILAVLVVSIGIQFSTATAARLQYWPFTITLLVVFSLLTLLGSAFVLIGRGVRQMEKIEKV